MRTIVLVLYVAFAACGTTKIKSPQYANGYADFASDTGYFPTTENPGGQWVQFSEGIQMQEVAKADAAWTQLANASTMHIVDASNALAIQETVAAAVEAASRGASDDSIIEAFCAGTTNRDPGTAYFCAHAQEMLRIARQQRGGGR